MHTYPCSLIRVGTFHRQESLGSKQCSNYVVSDTDPDRTLQCAGGLNLHCSHMHKDCFSLGVAFLIIALDEAFFCQPY